MHKVLCGVLLVGQVFAQAQVHETKEFAYDFDARGTLEVKNDVGKVTVKGSDVQNKVTVRVTGHADNQDDLKKFGAQIAVHNKDTELKVKSIGVKAVPHASIDLVVTLPRYTELDISSGVGSLLIEHVKGQMKLKTKTGDITVLGARKEVEATADTGNISVSFENEGFGKSDLKTDVGSITVDNAGGSVFAKVDTGNITVNQRQLPHKESIDMKVGTGSIRLILAKIAQAKIKAKTDNGKIKDGNLKWVRKPAPLAKGQPQPVSLKDKAVLTLGKGYADVDLKTKVGSILVELQ